MQQDSIPQPLISETNTQPFCLTGFLNDWAIIILKRRQLLVFSCAFSEFFKNRNCIEQLWSNASVCIHGCGVTSYSNFYLIVTTKLINSWNIEMYITYNGWQDFKKCKLSLRTVLDRWSPRTMFQRELLNYHL